MIRPVVTGLSVLAIALAAEAVAQERGTLNPQPLPPLADPADPNTPAKELFARKPEPVHLAARAIGNYVRGCLAGAVALPINGKTWQVMRVSRNRNWGHPDLIRFLERLANKVPRVGWPGLLVGDLAQPRGGPMLTGHTSHQIGLDADIWLTPMPDHALSRKEREEMSATNVVAADRTARQIAINAGEDGSVIVGKISEKDTYAYGYDAQEGHYGDLVSKGIIDPTKVVRTALQDAASIAALLITTEAMVAEKPKKETPMPAMPPGGGMDY